MPNLNTRTAVTIPPKIWAAIAADATKLLSYAPFAERHIGPTSDMIPMVTEEYIRFKCSYTGEAFRLSRRQRDASFNFQELRQNHFAVAAIAVTAMAKKRARTHIHIVHGDHDDLPSSDVLGLVQSCTRSTLGRPAEPLFDF